MSNKNKLPTCGDFIDTVDNTLSMNELKVQSKNLKICIVDIIDGQSVSSIASLCIKTIGY